MAVEQQRLAFWPRVPAPAGVPPYAALRASA
jgi:hypothetical protein